MHGPRRWKILPEVVNASRGVMVRYAVGIRGEYCHGGRPWRSLRWGRVINEAKNGKNRGFQNLAVSLPGEETRTCRGEPG